MLVINLKKNEVLRIGDSAVMYRRDRGLKGIELGVDAPPAKSIHREEYFVVLQKEIKRMERMKQEKGKAKRRHVKKHSNPE
jgi:sRNA-binding carbon storage regulator CsrA